MSKNKSKIRISPQLRVFLHAIEQKEALTVAEFGKIFIGELEEPYQAAFRIVKFMVSKKLFQVIVIRGRKMYLPEKNIVKHLKQW